MHYPRLACLKGICRKSGFAVKSSLRSSRGLRREAGRIRPAAAIAEKWRVPVFTTKVFDGQAHLREAAERINGDGRPVHVLNFGDHDGSGLAIKDSTETRLVGTAELAPMLKVDLLSHRGVAVTEEQIDLLDLPT